MLHHRRSFTCPAAPPNADQEEWEGIFGSEERRKQKMKRAIEKRKREIEEERARKRGDL
jgi:hypothetical protein